MTLSDLGGILGVLLILLAYAGIHFDWFDPKRAPALLMNLVGSLLILASMAHAFNLPAFFMEAAWAAMALFGLGKLLVERTSSMSSRPKRSAEPGPQQTPTEKPVTVPARAARVRDDRIR